MQNNLQQAGRKRSTEKGADCLPALGWPAAPVILLWWRWLSGYLAVAAMETDRARLRAARDVNTLMARLYLYFTLRIVLTWLLAKWLYCVLYVLYCICIIFVLPCIMYCIVFVLYYCIVYYVCIHCVLCSMAVLYYTFCNIYCIVFVLCIVLP